MWRAFVRGRHTRNLYAEPFGDALLDETVGEMRRRLALADELPAASLSDRTRFAAWVVFAVILAFATGAPFWLLVYGVGSWIL